MRRDAVDLARRTPCLLQQGICHPSQSQQNGVRDRNRHRKGENGKRPWVNSGRSVEANNVPDSYRHMCTVRYRHLRNLKDARNTSWPQT